MRNRSLSIVLLLELLLLLAASCEQIAEPALAPSPSIFTAISADAAFQQIVETDSIATSLTLRRTDAQDTTLRWAFLRYDTTVGGAHCTCWFPDTIFAFDPYTASTDTVIDSTFLFQAKDTLFVEGISNAHYWIHNAGDSTWYARRSYFIYDTLLKHG